MTQSIAYKNLFFFEEKKLETLDIHTKKRNQHSIIFFFLGGGGAR